MRSQITSPRGKKPASEGIGRGVGCRVSGFGCGVWGKSFLEPITLLNPPCWDQI
ncbi:hypothetical protein [Coleofasciculus sp. E2-BRE-01]|uniref:hypothetical protein n=1 Tax=Coleofasciculus sp. E2-BRE-01 TaxID=3069524 RepID=UPI0032F27571